MKIMTIIVTTTALSLGVNAALADRVHGGARANFKTDELTIPCVKIEEHSELANGMYYDIVLDHRGKSMNYALSYAEPEDPVLCQRIADLAEYEEDDENMAEILLQCDIEGDRSKIRINGKDLDVGDYYSIIYSDENSLESMTMASVEDEIEFKFDTDADAVLNGAQALEADFIVDEEVIAEIWLDGADEPALMATSACIVESTEEGTEDL